MRLLEQYNLTIPTVHCCNPHDKIEPAAGANSAGVVQLLQSATSLHLFKSQASRVRQEKQLPTLFLCLTRDCYRVSMYPGMACNTHMHGYYASKGRYLVWTEESEKNFKDSAEGAAAKFDLTKVGTCKQLQNNCSYAFYGEGSGDCPTHGSKLLCRPIAWATGHEDEEEDCLIAMQSDTRYVLLDNLQISKPSFIDAVNMALRVVESGRGKSVVCGRIQVEEKEVRISSCHDKLCTRSSAALL